MNIIDIIIVLILGVFLLVGLYRGFAVSALKFVSYFVTLILTFIIYPLVARLMFMSQGIVKNVRFYAEGAEKLATYESSMLKIAEIDSTMAQKLITDSMAKTTDGIKWPLDGIIRNNISTKAFPELTTVGEYFNESIVHFTINVLAFIIVFFIIKFAFTVFINILDHSISLPVLTMYDTAAGGGLAVINGVLILFVLFSIMPLVLNIIPVKFVQDLINNSLLGNLFFKGNFITGLIRGLI